MKKIILVKLYFTEIYISNNAIIHYGDNRTGVGEGDDEVLSIDFANIPLNIFSLAVIINSFKGNSLVSIMNAFIRLYDQTKFIGVNVLEQCPECTGLLLGIFKKEFLDYLSKFKFTGDIYSFKEGSVIFPYEPVIKVVARISQAQLIESALLSIINHNILIATKAHRIVYAATGKPVMEFGLRRAQNVDAGYYGSRAAVIAGCVGTSNVLAAKDFDMTPMGTHAHSFVMSHESELEAFRIFAKDYPDNCILLIDTYDTLRSGLENAITVFKEMKAAGVKSKKYGIRLDSGDLAYLSK